MITKIVKHKYISPLELNISTAMLEWIVYLYSPQIW